MPITVVNERVINGFNPRQLAEALNLGIKTDPRPPQITVPLLGRVLEAVERAVRQMPDEQLSWKAPDRDRPMNEFTYHIFGVSRRAFRGIVTGVYEPFEENAGRSFTRFEDVAEFGRQVVAEYKETQQTLDLDALAQRGPSPGEDVGAAEQLDRITGHAVQHLRQLYFVLESFDCTPNQKLEDSEFPPEYVLTILW